MLHTQPPGAPFHHPSAVSELLALSVIRVLCLCLLKSASLVFVVHCTWRPLPSHPATALAYCRVVSPPTPTHSKQTVLPWLRRCASRANSQGELLLCASEILSYAPYPLPALFTSPPQCASCHCLVLRSRHAVGVGEQASGTCEQLLKFVTNSSLIIPHLWLSINDESH